MSIVSRDLARKPLVEAILEIRWKISGTTDPAHPLYTGAIAGLVGDVYPFQVRLPAIDVPDEYSHYIAKFQLRTGPEQWPLIQLGPGIATLNSTQEYSWNDFYQRAMQLWENLHRVYPTFNGGAPPEVDHLVLKYINAFPLEGMGPQEFLAEKLNTAFVLPDGIASHETAPSPHIAALQVAYPLKKAGTSGVVRILTGTKRESPAMIVELSADGRLSGPVHQEDFANWLDYSHAVIERWFFAFIDGELFKSFTMER
ncbi:hypothetical protein Cs7R123_29700 [Catellatospora sp. TT07R-123]|uniref:TIGR04255 family protein n=1 Tax=Catellatospora sp. TT07R-123 TaxID=2733863 RepID=UPI001B2F31D5|nr:TIGR04255 family protein [Catellatospora sp. TT07R-123]GHJ45628.1 hypothetical protein Cs7R123_29700 [Catellatospora sp. TT07R-123]